MREVTLQFESNIKAPGKSRSHLAQMKPNLEPRYEDVLLVVSELVSNSVRHSNSDEIELTVEAGDGHVRVQVSDDGPGFSRDAPRGEGMGLIIVEKLAERWGLVSGKRFTVWAELSLAANP